MHPDLVSFRVYVCLNGREWLARQMDQAGLRYVRRDNTFTWLEDLDQAQALLDQQAQANWPQLLDACALAANPAQSEILARFPCHYYWSVGDSEWASDVLFPSPEALATVYPRLLRYAITTFTPVDVMRFLGQPVPASGKVPHACRHEISSNIKERREGVRIKHWLNGNSLKMYDKGSVLRVETLIRDPGDFKVYRPLEGDPQGPKEWRPLRKGSATCRVGPRSARRPTSQLLWGALTAVQDTTPLRQLVEPLVPARLAQRAYRPSPAAPPTSSPPQGATGRPRVRRGPTCRRPRVPCAGPRVPRQPRAFRAGIGADGTGAPASAGRRGRVGIGGPTGPRRWRHGGPRTGPRPGARRPKGWRWAPAGAGA